MSGMNGYREPAEKIVAHELDHGPEVVPGQYWPTPAHHGIDARQYSQQVPPGSGSDVRRICGLHRSTFYLALVLAVVIIVGSVGGGVGGSLAVKNAQRGAQSAQESQATPTPIPTETTIATSSATGSASGSAKASATGSPTTTTRISMPTFGLLALDCPSISGTTASLTAGGQSSSYDLDCGVDNNGDGIDIIAVVSWSLEDCLRVCSSFNANRKSGSESCAGVQFHADIVDLVSRFSGNCFLKNTEGRAVTDTNSTNFNLHVSAMLYS
ncbi:hypothetical protein CGCF415_v001274 [Colletotrichum fructicola]|uniref:Apple domain-containing protein n=2 Tax=Colletotrichum fructicola (strain Nara gc5) TaxID=1213859 RepID=A0A7J6J4M5_COLFN|nr:uncharacterized protein CGMCC3_g6870 [Colletotrichum fructicola]KAF4484791.1 hypothetical protein CGGC5_v007521 [Colletotrichum fructicola Nara gc5]KAE9577150.1 hypothetical protein CGMCC3_g6870 [Colletotrichum fructicola]KAF4416844.1 hypothetical protein CFRS1_v003987 [Colletotrichum fructicola]KAF4905264.1 hypothetical protein CGCFRS4_v000660 [Colletotrichum fructicola]KAF4915675.1 hypothetical protein CGCF415_v001274 [Colletotrichum fructicola]